MKTLMATDGSQEATSALRTAANLIRKNQNDVSVLCVAPELYLPRGKRKVGKREAALIADEYRKRIAQETQAILEKAQEALRAEGIEAKAISQTGSPADVIVRVAADYDVTVVGAIGMYQSPHLGLGPVASRVLEHAPGTVLIAREMASEGVLRVLVGVDGSAASTRALNTMSACFNLDEAEITLLHVKETPWIHLGLDREWFDYPGDAFDRADPEIQLEEEMQREAETVIEEAHARLSGYSYSVVTIIEEGNPATVILDEAEKGEYDLVVLGATGLRDIKHRMLGSVSTKVARQARCSLAVVNSVD
jgi:nucleotide-binding universal stress UspA family protein